MHRDPEAYCCAIHPAPSTHVAAYHAQPHVLHTIPESWKSHISHWACLGCSGWSRMMVCSTSCRYLATSNCHWSQVTGSALCKVDVSPCMMQIVVTPDSDCAPLTLHIYNHCHVKAIFQFLINYAFLVAYYRDMSRAVIMLFNQHLDMSNRCDGLSQEEDCSLTQILILFLIQIWAE